MRHNVNVRGVGQLRVRPITSPGTWTLEGGYRRRAEQFLQQLEQKVTAMRATLPPPGVRRPLPALSAIDEVHALKDSVVIFAALAVESFLNLYGVIRLGEVVYARRYERLPPVRKLSRIFAACGILLGPQDEIATVVARLFARRNALVHPKTHEVPERRPFPVTKPHLQVAQETVEDMRRFHELFLTYDTDAGKWWHA